VAGDDHAREQVQALAGGERLRMHVPDSDHVRRGGTRLAQYELAEAVLPEAGVSGKIASPSQEIAAIERSTTCPLRKPYRRAIASP
jgi:hypothetical protein